jgi:hypothetical protein
MIENMSFCICPLLFNILKHWSRLLCVTYTLWQNIAQFIRFTLMNTFPSILLIWIMLPWAFFFMPLYAEKNWYKLNISCEIQAFMKVKYPFHAQSLTQSLLPRIVPWWKFFQSINKTSKQTIQTHPVYCLKYEEAIYPCTNSTPLASGRSFWIRFLFFLVSSVFFSFNFYLQKRHTNLSKTNIYVLM